MPTPSQNNLQVIQRWEAVQLINSGVPVTVEFVEADRRRGTGGRLRKLVNWAILTKDIDTSGLAAHVQRKQTWQRQKITLDNEIIMMYDPDNNMKHPIPVHYWLLCTINGKRIV